MSIAQWLAVAALCILVLLAPLSMVWLWRDMRERKRPVWLRVLVLATGFVTGIGIILWILDVARHPHDPRLTRREIALQRYKRS